MQQPRPKRPSPARRASEGPPPCSSLSRCPGHSLPTSRYAGQARFGVERPAPPRPRSGQAEAGRYWHSLALRARLSFVPPFAFFDPVRFVKERHEMMAAAPRMVRRRTARVLRSPTYARTNCLPCGRARPASPRIVTLHLYKHGRCSTRGGCSARDELAQVVAGKTGRRMLRNHDFRISWDGPRWERRPSERRRSLARTPRRQGFEI